ncbi:MAG TPA: MFS transporter [Verrucomicrobiae bacterium]|nr:MFS transporter [Verrucomicrobiae bacterium]
MTEIAAPAASGSVWAPLRRPVFRNRLIASIISNTGSWMQDTAGAWLMTSLTSSSLLIALMQTAASLPVLLMGLLAGATADVLDRRRLLLVWSGWMLAAAVVLSVLTLWGWIGPLTLLLLTFLLSTGSAMNGPTWQAIVPELVSREELSEAIALNSAGFNLARAVGPAAGGLTIAAFASASRGAGIVFLINALSFVAVLFVIYRWKRTPLFTSALPAERLVASMRSGLRYTRFAPELRAILVRAFLQTFCVSGMWALLAVVAKAELRNGAMGYGILTGCIGVGAVVGAMLVPALRKRFSSDSIVTGAALAFTVTLLVMGWAHGFWPLAAALVLGGMAWTSTTSCLNIAVQLSVPAWVQARSLGIYQMVFQGGMAIGSAVWGALAEHTSTSLALSAGAAGLLLGLPLARRFPLMAGATPDLSPGRLAHALSRSVPQVMIETRPEEGPVLITITFQIDPARAEEFTHAAHAMGRVRRRDGAIRWSLFRDPVHPGRSMESYVLESWLERERQIERFTVADHAIRNRLMGYHIGENPPDVSRMILARPREQ